MKEKIDRILKSANYNWFTNILYWKQNRYVIWLTHNKNPSKDLLFNQYLEFKKQFDNLTIWWRLDKKTNIYYIDIGTTTNNLIKAKRLQLAFKQIAIFDLQEMREI